MRKFLLLVILVTAGLFSFTQNKIINEPNAQVRPVKGFHAIHVATGIHLYLTQSNEEAVAVSSSKEEYRDMIKTEVENGVLKIYFNNDVSRWQFWNGYKGRLNAYVSCKTLDELKGSSGALVEVDGTLKSTNLKMHFSSGSRFRGRVEIDELKMEQNSGAHATISGTAASLKTAAGSGSMLDGFDLETGMCEAKASSGAQVNVTVHKELSAAAHSGGQVNYRGEGVIKDIDTGSGGHVSKR